MKTLIFKLSKDSQLMRGRKITNNYVFDIKINAHTRNINYTIVHIKGIKYSVIKSKKYI